MVLKPHVAIWEVLPRERQKTVYLPPSSANQLLLLSSSPSSPVTSTMRLLLQSFDIFPEFKFIFDACLACDTIKDNTHNTTTCAQMPRDEAVGGGDRVGQKRGSMTATHKPPNYGMSALTFLRER